MAIPVDSPVGALVAAKRYREAHAPNKACLALAIASGLAGALNPSADGWVVRAGIPLAFGVALVFYAVSLLGDTDLDPLLGQDVNHIRDRIRVASRHVYYLLYGLAGTKLIQSFLSPMRGVTHGEAMHPLWPYLAAGLISLVIIRVRCIRFLSAR